MVPKIESIVRFVTGHVSSVWRSSSLRFAFAVGLPVSGHDLKLHLGCGPVHVPGFLNVDIDLSFPAVDVLDDVRKLRRCRERSAAVIYACHVLEHFSHAEVLLVLRRWCEVLKPGGELRVSVPDIDRIVQIYSKNWQHFQTPPNTPWIGLIYGGEASPYDYHKTGFNFAYLKYLLLQVGFVDVEEYPQWPHWLGIEDDSLANEPFKEYVSVNVKAKKPVENAKGQGQ